MLQYKAGCKFVDGGVHAQVLDFPAAITCADTLDEARRLLAVALLDAAEAALESGMPLPLPNPLLSNPEMDIEEPMYLHLHVSSRASIVDVLAQAPGQLAFGAADKVDSYLREEREAWER
jgi:predicted RNase H-like HicB family nuclease